MVIVRLKKKPKPILLTVFRIGKTAHLPPPDPLRQTCLDLRLNALAIKTASAKATRTGRKTIVKSSRMTKRPHIGSTSPAARSNTVRTKSALSPEVSPLWILPETLTINSPPSEVKTGLSPNYTPFERRLSTQTGTSTGPNQSLIPASCARPRLAHGAPKLVMATIVLTMIAAW